MMLYHKNGEECPKRVISYSDPVRVHHIRRPDSNAWDQQWECPGHPPPDLYQQTLDALPTAKWVEEQLATGEGLDRERLALHIWGNLVMALQEKLTAGGAR